MIAETGRSWITGLFLTALDARVEQGRGSHASLKREEI
jgi:hypothetical protein